MDSIKIKIGNQWILITESNEFDPVDSYLWEQIDNIRQVMQKYWLSATNTPYDTLLIRVRNKLDEYGELERSAAAVTDHPAIITGEAQSNDEIPEVRITAELEPIQNSKYRGQFHDRECDTCHEMYTPKGPRGTRCDKCRGIKKAKKDRLRSRVESIDHEDPKLHAGPPMEGPYSPV